MDDQLNDEVPLIGDAYGNRNAKPGIFRLFVLVFISCIGSISFGFTLGYSSPAIAKILNDTDFADRNTFANMQSLFASMPLLTAVAGGPIAGALAEKMGRKACIIILCLPMVLGWVLIASAVDVAMILVGRALTGVGMGMASLVTPLYITEISTANLRGLLGSAFQLFVVIGVLLVYALGVGDFLSWRYLAIAGAVLPSVLCLAMGIIGRESPRWLCAEARVEEAARMLTWLRGPVDGEVLAERELADIQEALASKPRDKFHVREVTHPSVYKPLLLSFGLMFFQQFSGINSVIFYTQEIFQDAGFKGNASYSAIIVGAVQVVSTFIACVLMDKAGRRILLITAGVIMTVSAVGLGLYFYLTSVRHMTGLGWLSLLTLNSFVAGFSLAWGPIPWLAIGELFSQRSKGFASTCSTMLNWLLAFAVTYSFQFLTSHLAIYGTFWLFAGFCVLSVLFVACFLPETKGRRLEEIERYFAGTPSVGRVLLNEAR